MAISVTLDIAQNTQLDVPSSQLAVPKRFVRVALIDGIDVSTVTGSPKVETMWLAQNAVLAAIATDTFQQRHPEMALRRIILDPISDVQAIARLVYENIIFGIGIPPSTYIMTDGATMTTRQTTYLPGQGVSGRRRQKLAAAWDAPPELADDNPEGPARSKFPTYSRIDEDFVPMSFMFPMRTIKVSALIYGRPTKGQQYIGHVNDSPWPSSSSGNNIFGTFAMDGNPDDLGLPKGYWLLTEYTTAYSRYGGYYQLESQALTRVVEDWSDGGTLLDTKTGKYVQVGADIESGDEIIDALFAEDYSYGVTKGIDPAHTSRDTGFIRVCPYKEIDFTQIFGF